MCACVCVCVCVCVLQIQITIKCVFQAGPVLPEILSAHVSDLSFSGLTGAFDTSYNSLFTLSITL